MSKVIGMSIEVRMPMIVVVDMNMEMARPW
jgi:hypothetical protein